jgi:hypothetical protein
MTRREGKGRKWTMGETHAVNVSEMNRSWFPLSRAICHSARLSATELRMVKYNQEVRDVRDKMVVNDTGNATKDNV